MSNETARWFLGYPHPITKTQPDAGTSSWPSWISHFTGSFVGHSPSEMLCPPANIVQNLVDTKQNHQPNKRKFYICADGPHTQHCHTTLSHTALSPNQSCTISFPSCLSRLIFTSAWWSLEEVDMWGYPVLLFCSCRGKE